MQRLLKMKQLTTNGYWPRQSNLALTNNQSIALNNASSAFGCITRKSRATDWAVLNVQRRSGGNSDDVIRQKLSRAVGFAGWQVKAVRGRKRKKLLKRAQRMPWRKIPTKDARSCDKLRGAAYYALIRRCPNGETSLELCLVAPVWIYRTGER